MSAPQHEADVAIAFPAEIDDFCTDTVATALFRVMGAGTPASAIVVRALGETVAVAMADRVEYDHPSAEHPSQLKTYLTSVVTYTAAEWDQLQLTNRGLA